MGNVDSVVRAVEECGGTPVVTSQASELCQASHVILPGVGAFPDGIRNLQARALDKTLREHVLDKRIPFLGVCLGMQMLATTGSEGGMTEGLCWVEGAVERLVPDGPEARVPHIGWNEVMFVRDSLLFTGIPSGRNFYFVHSYHLRCRDDADVVAVTPYCSRFVAAIERGMIFGVQFHPEKSQRLGLQVLKNFLSV